MPIPDSNYSTLTQIRTKIRRLTRSPSTSQLSDADIDNYVNNFVLYDFPHHINLFELRKTLSFYTEPYIALYSTNTTDPLNPLYNFDNEYITVHPPVYIAGNKVELCQSREQFFNRYPQIATGIQIGTGDGVTTHYTGTLSSKPILRNNVLFSSINNNNGGLEAHDDGNGLLIGDVAVAGAIDYVTGVYDFTYVLAPQLGKAITAQVYAYTPSRPQAVLFFNNNFQFRPVPDQPYKVTFEVTVRPDRLLSTSSMPQISQWWQYIAYGASIKVFQDRMDQESAQLLMPEFKQQELLVLRKTIVEQSNERVATVFTESDYFGPNNPFGGGGGLV